MFHSIIVLHLAGSLQRFHRVCDKIQTVIANQDHPTDFVDSENRSGSSDDTLTLHSTNGVSHDSGKGSSASVDVLVQRATNPGGMIRPSILRDDSTDSEDDLLDD